MKYDDSYLKVIRQLDEEGMNGDQIISAMHTLETESKKMNYKQLRILYAVISTFIEFFLLPTLGHKFIKKHLFDEE